MEKVTFQDKECYIAYKGLKYNLSNYQNNYTYELNKWYSVLDVDMSDISCSFGINLCLTKESALEFGCRVFKCYVPANTKIKFIGNQDKFRCLEMYLTDEESEFAWNELTEEQKNLVCQNPNFQYKKYWNELTWYQKNCVCRYNTNFQYKKYWNELTERQKDYICQTPNFQYKEYWNELTERQKDYICQYNLNFQYKKYWNELTWYQKNCVYQNPNFQYKEYWNELTERQKDYICQYNSKFQYKKYWNELTEEQKALLKARIIKKEETKT